MLSAGRPTAVTLGTSGAAGFPVHVVDDNHQQVGRPIVSALTSGASRTSVESPGTKPEFVGEVWSDGD